MADVFISYAHEDEKLVERMSKALTNAGREVWVDVEGIETGDRWKPSAHEAIERSDAFVFVLSSASLASEPCLGELEHARSQNKRVIAICVEEAARDLDKPQIVDELSWLMMRPEDDFDAGIARLMKALDTDLEIARTHTRILVRATAWDLAGRRWSPLLRGDELRSAEVWLSNAMRGGGPQPTNLQHEFISSSRHATSRRRRIGVGITSAGMMIALALAIVALNQRSQALASERIAQSRRLAAEAESTLAGDASLSTLLALRALSIRYTLQAEQALRDALGQLQTLNVLRGDTAPVKFATFSPDGSQILTASQDGSARVWSARSGASVRVLMTPDVSLTKATFSPDGSEILTASDLGTARIYSARSGAQLAEFHAGSSELTDAEFSPDATKIVTASADGTARIWDVHGGPPLLVVNPHAGIVETAAFSPDGSRVLTAQASGPALVWGARTGARLLAIKAPGAFHNIDGAVWSPDARRIATALNVGAAVWDARTGALIAVVEGPFVSVERVAFSPDGSRLVTTGDSHVQIWSAANGEPLADLTGAVGTPTSAQYSPDGSRIVTAGEDPTARIWNARFGSTVSVFAQPVPQLAGAFSPDGTRVVTAGADGKTRVWDARSGTVQLTLSGHRRAVDSAAFSADGARVVTGNVDGTARVWDAHSGSPLFTVTPAPATSGQAEAIGSVAFSPDNSRILGSALNFVWLWNARDGTPLATYQSQEGVERAALSSDGSRIAVAGQEGGMRVLDAATGAQLLSFDDHGGAVNSAAFSADGSRLVMAGEDGTTLISNAHTGGPELSLSSGPEAVDFASFSPDGSQVLTSSADGTARIWDAHSGARLLVLNNQELFSFKRLPATGSFTDARFSPDGSQVITTSTDGTVRIWSTELAAPLHSLERIARSLVTRSFTPDERRTYLAGITR